MVTVKRMVSDDPLDGMACLAVPDSRGALGSVQEREGACDVKAFLRKMLDDLFVT